MKIKTSRACTVMGVKKKAGDKLDLPGRIANKMIRRGLAAADSEAKAEKDG